MDADIKYNDFKRKVVTIEDKINVLEEMYGYKADDLRQQYDALVSNPSENGYEQLLTHINTLFN